MFTQNRNRIEENSHHAIEQLILARTNSSRVSLIHRSAALIIPQGPTARNWNLPLTRNWGFASHSTSYNGEGTNREAALCAISGWNGAPAQPPDQVINTLTGAVPENDARAELAADHAGLIRVISECSGGGAFSRRQMGLTRW